MRRIILSRKGFDSSSGETASPIFSDDTIFSIPIPSKAPSPHRYSDLEIHGISGNTALKEACVSSVASTDYCLFDPDLRSGIGLFGQANSSQSELRNREVGKNDLFLFFGWCSQRRQTTPGDRASRGLYGLCNKTPERLARALRLK